MKKKLSFFPKFLITIAVLCIFIIASNTFRVDAAGFTDDQTVDKSKSWVIKFNMAVASEGMESAITIKDSKEINAGITLKLSGDEKSITVNAPQNGYTPGETYTLNIDSTKLYSKITKKKLKESISMKFKISTNDSGFISTAIADLVSQGTINQSQADKIIAIIGNLAISEIKSGPGGQLSSLVQDGTITIAQEQAVLTKLGISSGGGVPGGGGIPGGGTSSSIVSVPKYKDIVYGADSSNNKLDIYIPSTGTAPYPVVIAVHGGAFKSGSKTGGDVAYIIDNSVENGYAVVSVDYRLSGTAKAPAAVNDIKAAIRFIRANSDKYGLAADKIAAWGDSAGGNLVSMIGTTGDKSNLEGDTKNLNENSDQSSAVQAVVDWFGPIYFSTMDAEFKELGITPATGTTSSASSPESAYIGYTVGTEEAEPYVKKASPQTYISSDDAAFLIQHGDVDGNIPYTQSQNFAAKLTEVLGADKVNFQLIKGAKHGDTAFTTSVDKAFIFEFLNKYIK